MAAKHGLMQKFKSIHEYMAKSANNMLKNFDITFPQSQVLKLIKLSENGLLSFKQLEKELMVSQPTVVGLVSRLEEKDFVCVVNHQTDKRIKLVKISDRGEAILQKIKSKILDLEKLFFKNFNEQEILQFKTLISKIDSNIQEEK